MRQDAPFGDGQPRFSGIAFCKSLADPRGHHA
jgi:hypothetical protein